MAPPPYVARPPLHKEGGGPGNLRPPTPIFGPYIKDQAYAWGRSSSGAPSHATLFPRYCSTSGIRSHFVFKHEAGASRCQEHRQGSAAVTIDSIESTMAESIWKNAGHGTSFNVHPWARVQCSHCRQPIEGIAGTSVHWGGDCSPQWALP